eukprot:scaffold85348_cov35-Tisochrysis_lutea.AAC.1
MASEGPAGPSGSCALPVASLVTHLERLPAEVAREHRARRVRNSRAHHLHPRRALSCVRLPPSLRRA